MLEINKKNNKKKRFVPAEIVQGLPFAKHFLHPKSPYRPFLLFEVLEKKVIFSFFFCVSIFLKRTQYRRQNV